ncbi:MAG: helix-turn-helix transcriptional regulator [Terriglobia bacterium]
MEQRLIKSERAQFIEKLKDWKYREAYIRASININLPSQIRALRLRQEMTQGELAKKSNMLQPRISAIEKPGAIKFNIETLIRLAAAFEVGLIVKFVPISEMVNWENKFSQDEFNVVTFARDGEMPSVESQAISGYYSSVPSTPAISFVDPPRTMRARPELDFNVPADPASTTTVQSIQLFSQAW